MESHDSDMLMEDPGAVGRRQSSAGLDDLTTMTPSDKRMSTLVGDSIEGPNYNPIQNLVLPPQNEVEKDPCSIWNKQNQKLRRYIISARTFLASNKTSAEKDTILCRHIISVTGRLRKLHIKEAQLARRSLQPPEMRHSLSSPAALYRVVRDPDLRQWLIPIKRVFLERLLARLRLWRIRIQYQNNLHHPEVFKAARNMDHAVYQFQKAHDQVLEGRNIRPKPDPSYSVVVAVISGLRGGTSLPELVERKFAMDVESRYCRRSESHYDNKLSEQDKSLRNRRCPVLAVEPCPMQAVPIFPLKAAQEGMLGIFGAKMFPELITAHNGLWLTTVIAEMFARFEVTIVPYDHPFQDDLYYRIHFVNVPDQTLAQLTYSGRPGERFADLDGKKLEFLNEFRPRTEFLYFHHVCALIALWTRESLQKKGREHYLNPIEASASEGRKNNVMYSSCSKNFDHTDTEFYRSLFERSEFLFDKFSPSNRNLVYLRSIWKVEGTHLRRQLMQKLAIKYGAALPDGHRNHCKRVADDYVSEDEEMLLDLLVEDAIRFSLEDKSPPPREPSIYGETGEEIEEIICDSVDEDEDEDEDIPDSGEEEGLETKQNNVEIEDVRETTDQDICSEIDESEQHSEGGLETNQNNVEMEDIRETIDQDISSEIDESERYSEDFEDYDDERDLDYRE